MWHIRTCKWCQGSSASDSICMHSVASAHQQHCIVLQSMALFSCTGTGRVVHAMPTVTLTCHGQSKDLQMQSGITEVCSCHQMVEIGFHDAAYASMRGHGISTASNEITLGGGTPSSHASMPVSTLMAEIQGKCLTACLATQAYVHACNCQSGL